MFALFEALNRSLDTTAVLPPIVCRYPFANDEIAAFCDVIEVELAAHARIGGQHEVEQGRLAAGAAALLEHVRDGGGADRAPGERLGERRLQRRRAALIEQAHQARDLTGEASMKAAACP